MVTDMMVAVTRVTVTIKAGITKVLYGRGIFRQNGEWNLKKYG
jgi:hypothetical protein